MHQGIRLAGVAGLGLLVGLAGCQVQERTATISDRDAPFVDENLVEPDFIVVEDLTVTPSDSRALRQLRPSEGSDRVQTNTERTVGQIWVDELASQLVAELDERDIQAYTPENAPDRTFKTGTITGYFFEDRADGSRLIGFGLGKRDISMRTIFHINEVTIAAMSVDAPTALTTTSLADRGEAGVTSTAANDAARVAELIADEVRAAYERRGWRVAP